MKERLIVKSFGPVRELDLTFSKVTVFIGDQGVGKSCVAKLFSMFKWLEKALTMKKYSLDYFEKYNRFRSKLCAYHGIDTYISDESYIEYNSDLFRFVYCNTFSIEKSKKGGGSLAKVMYIPAERSIVSVAENKPKLLKELPESCAVFYDEFVNAKKSFQYGFQLPFKNLYFEYDALNDASWICGETYKLRLINASSGIQSSLPLCIVTEYLSRKVEKKTDIQFSKEEKERLARQIAEIMSNSEYSEIVKDTMIRTLSATTFYGSLINIVEEPELNLFPESQIQVLSSLVANNASTEGNMLVLTTHSPYILAIINMMIMRDNVYKKISLDKTKSGLNEVVNSVRLASEQISAYRLDCEAEDYCKSIVNKQTGLISKNDLDSASQEIMKSFNSLIKSYADTDRR